MAFDFPTSPTVGQKYTLGEIIYIWNGYAWDAAGGGGGASISVADLPPADPSDNMLWWEADSGDLYLYFNDGNSKQWVQVNGGGAYALAHTDDVPPVNPVDGQLWWRSSNGHMYVWYDDGSSGQWVDTNIPVTPVKTAQTRNRVMNPAMQVAQETTGAVASGFYPVDQFVLACSIATGTAVYQGSSGPDGLAALATNVSTGKPTLVAADNWQLYQWLEYLQIYDFLWGTAKAKPIVVRFWAYSNQAGTYTFRISNAAGNRHFLAPFTLPTGVYKEVIVPVPGDATGAWVVGGTAAAASFHWGLAAGSTYAIGVPGWQSGATPVQIAGQTNLAQTNGNAFYLANVGMYLDPDNTGVPPPFEVPNFADDLRACQRYYEPLTTTIYGYQAAGNTIMTPVFYKAVKRVTPTVGIPTYGSVSNGATLLIYDSFAANCQLGINASATGMVTARNVVVTASARM